MEAATSSPTTKRYEAPSGLRNVETSRRASSCSVVSERVEDPLRAGAPPEQMLGQHGVEEHEGREPEGQSVDATGPKGKPPRTPRVRPHACDRDREEDLLPGLDRGQRPAAYPESVQHRHRGVVQREADHEEVQREHRPSPDRCRSDQKRDGIEQQGDGGAHAVEGSGGVGSIRLHPRAELGYGPQGNPALIAAAIAAATATSVICKRRDTDTPPSADCARPGMAIAFAPPIITLVKDEAACGGDLRKETEHMSANQPETIGQRLRRLRLERGLSQRELSAPGVSYAYISRIEAGTRQPSVKALRKLAPKLGVSTEYLETGSQMAARPSSASSSSRTPSCSCA